MIYKYTKCESVIAKIMSDSNMSEKNMRVTDMREWIFEAVEKIGAPMQYIQRESGQDGCPVFELCDCQIPIPEDLESLTAVAYSPTPAGPWVPVRKDDMSFHRPHVTLHDSYDINPMHDPENVATDYPETAHIEGECEHYHPMRYKVPTTRSQYYTSIGHANPDILNLNRAVREEPTYFIKPGWIVLNKHKGFVRLSYKSIATDERGYPLIPDLASYQEAIYWYVMMKLNFPKFLTGSLGGKSKYNFNTYMYLQQQWNFYRNQAYAEAMMPNEGEMRSIKNEWTKLIPDWSADDQFFYRSGKRQMNYNDYYYGR